MAYALSKKWLQTNNSFAENTDQAKQSTVARGGALGTNSVIQAKLSVGAANTPAEQEADRVATQIVGGTSRLHEQDSAMNGLSGGQTEMVQRDVEAGADGGSFSASADMAASMEASSAQTLDSAAATQIGSHLGADFSGVRIHTDKHAQQVATGMSARAFTKGKDIYFNKGQYNPKTAAGKELLAHELTHTIQQGKVSQNGGIPVQQTASSQTAQRGFLNLRKHFRNAVDERNENYEDYKNQSKWTRFKWAVKNPLAWALGRTESNQEATKKRAARRELIANLDPKTLKLPREHQTGAVAERAKTLEKILPAGGLAARNGVLEGTPASRRAAELDKVNQSIGEKNAGERSVQSASRVDKMMLASMIPGAILPGVSAAANMVGKWGEAEGMGSTIADYANDWGLDKVGELNDAFSNATEKVAPLLEAASGVMSIAGGGLGAISGVLDARNAMQDADEYRRGGDKRAARARAVDAVTAGLGVGKGVTAVTKGVGILAGAGGVMAAPLTAVTGTLNAAAGVSKAVAGGIEVDRARKVKKSTSKAKDDYENKLQNLNASLENKEMTPQERESAEAYKKQLQLQAGFMRMGHNTARVDHTRAGFKVADGVINAVGGAVSVGGGVAGLVGTGIGLAGTITGLVGKGVTSNKNTKLKRGEVDLTLNMKQRIADMVEQSKKEDEGRDPKDRINLTEREAKHIILRQEGFASRSEAYVKMAKERKEAMNKMSKEERDAMVGALQLDTEKASDALIYQRLGLDKKQSQNVDRAILKQQKKRSLPSWRR